MSDSLLGDDFWRRIHPYTGDVVKKQRTARGFSSDLTALVSGSRGTFFVKAVANRPGGRRDSIMRERQINPAVVPISPALRWHAENEAWIVLGFEAVAGRFSDFTPGSQDLPVVVDLLNRIGELPLPDVAQSWAETRWDRYVEDPADTALFAGDALLYTDINPSNLLVPLLNGPQDSWAVDWSWPTRGAAFIDSACLVLQLVAAGHTPESAESWATGCAAWVSADPKAVDVFATANQCIYRQLAERRPDTPWLAAMAAAAQAWVNYRTIPRNSH